MAEQIMMPIETLENGVATYNPRIDLQEGDRDFEILKDNIEKFGFVQPIVWNESTGTVVGGHQRLKVAKALGYGHLPTVIVSLSEKDEKILNLALNKVGGSFDQEKLGMLLNDLRMEDVDLNLTGFDTLEVEELTLAFANTDTNFEEFDGGTLYEPEDGDDERDDSDLEEEKGYTIQTNIVFDDETQQEVWNDFLRKLKSDYDNDAFPTHASRIHAFLMKEVFTNGERD
ncbi:DNA adenine methyltransferase [Bacillus phage vB_BceS-M2]